MSYDIRPLQYQKGATKMKLLIIEDGNDTGLMIVPNLYDDIYALEQADITFGSGRIDTEVDIPDIKHKGISLYVLYRGVA